MYDKMISGALLVGSLLAFALLAYSAYDEKFAADWYGYQSEYKQQLAFRAETDRDRLAAERYGVGQKQLFLPDLNRVDRCVTCHVAVDNPAMADAPQPLTSHPGDVIISHPKERFGCTICHLGQGRATTQADAHGHVPHWPEPMVSREEMHQACIRCHTERSLDGAEEYNLAMGLVYEKACLACHKIRGKGGDVGPVLDRAGELHDAEWHFKHFKDPKSVVATSEMPDLKLTDEDTNRLVSLMMGLVDPPIPADLLSIPQPKAAGAPAGEPIDALALGDFVGSKFCISCHAGTHPDAVNGWRESRMATTFERIKDETIKDNCLPCHTTGYNVDTGHFAEEGVSCEACHGPGKEAVKLVLIGKTEEHKKLTRIDPNSKLVCARCHNPHVPVGTHADYYRRLPPRDPTRLATAAARFESPATDEDWSPTRATVRAPVAPPQRVPQARTTDSPITGTDAPIAAKGPRPSATSITPDSADAASHIPTTSIPGKGSPATKLGDTHTITEAPKPAVEETKRGSEIEHGSTTAKPTTVKQPTAVQTIVPEPTGSLKAMQGSGDNAPVGRPALGSTALSVSDSVSTGEVAPASPEQGSNDRRPAIPPAPSEIIPAGDPAYTGIIIAPNTRGSSASMPGLSTSILEPQRGCTAGGCHTEMIADFKVHGPTAVGLCQACHRMVNPEAHRFQLTKQQPELCYQCHGNPPDAEYKHGPVALGMCTVCHDPHSGPARLMLRADGQDLCFTCHTEMGKHVQHAQVQHEAITEKGCTACHDPHRGNHQYQLKNDVPDLCLQCHPQINEIMQQATTHHDALTIKKKCVNCHNPHGSDVPKILRDVEMNLCLGCHDEELETPTGTIIDMKSWIEDNPERHGPIRLKNCTACHQPHGSENFRILKKTFPAEFYRPFELETYSLCFGCHEKTLVLDEETTTLTGFRNGEKNLHFLHVNREKGRTCRACHEIHAGTKPKRIKDFVPFGVWKYPVNFEKNEHGGSCAPGCHIQRRYDRREEIIQK